MLNNSEIIKIAQETLLVEARSLEQSSYKIDNNFVRAVQIISNCSGRVVITGIGKSANIANKIVATFNSTGTPAVFMHAAEAIHGDLGVLLQNDVVICISNSGNSPEIKILVPFIKERGNKIIAIVGNSNSFLATKSDCIIDSKVENEACSFISAPTSSTTVQLALGDALAVCLIHNNGFTNDDFVKSHPGGSIGKKLSLTVGEIASNHLKPEVDLMDNLQKIIFEISSKRLGATAVCSGNKVVGIITDGDIRRMLEKNTELSGINAQKIMGINPKTITNKSLATEAFVVMNSNSISQVIVVDENNQYFGMIHIHDLVKEGLTKE